MKRISVILIITILSALMFTGCGTSSDSDADNGANSYRQVSSEEAATMMEEETDYIILDVRTQEEYEAAHIPGAICIPNETIGDEKIEALPDKDQLILIYCRSGNRSKQASEKLAKQGYTNIVEFGGINSWTGETVSGSEA